MKDELDLDKLPLKMCGLSRCICMPNIKSLSVMAQKLWPMLKLSSNKQTDKQTNRQTGQKQYAPQILSGGHKKPLTNLYEMNSSNVFIRTESSMLEKGNRQTGFQRY